jgi:3'-5' exoribonuclease
MKDCYAAGITAGQSVDTSFLVVSKERKTASNGSAYLDLQLQDSTGVLRAKLWDADRHATDFEPDDIVRAAGTVDLFQGALQLKLRRIERLENGDFALEDYLPRSERDPEENFNAVLDRVRATREGPLRSLLLGLLEDPALAKKYKLAPAATSYHHAYLGGLVEHVRSLLGLADSVAGHYPELDVDLVIAGIVLHDIGKTEELAFGRGFRYTRRGKLLGHITLGLDLVDAKIRAIPDFPEDLADRLEHIILSHHGKFEFGSPKEPAFAEALVVHYLDDLDSKLASIRAQYAAESAQAGEWTTRNRALGRELLKPADGATPAPAIKNGPGKA